MAAPATTRLAFVFGFLACSPGIALGDSDTRTVDCARGDIQRELAKKNPDRPLTVVVSGICAGDVSIMRDDVTLLGDGGTVLGTINIVGAQRVLIKALTVSSPAGAGVAATQNASFTVEDSTLERNGTEAIAVSRGAHGTIRRNLLANNGQAGVPDTGRGIDVRHGGAVDASNNTIVSNRSDGVGVFNGSYARLVQNTIEGNGRLSAGESGIQVNRSRVRSNGNVIRNNTGISAVAVVNHSTYRTGTGLNAVDFPDNEFAFERIEHAVGGGRLAIDVNNASYGDFRQVHVVGSVAVGRQSMLQVRGDDVTPNLQCSTITVPPGGGPIQVSGRNGLLRLQFVNVTPPVFSIGTPNGQLDGSPVCVVP